MSEIYRDYLYVNYKDDLEKNKIFKTVEKERKAIEKYMKRNYKKYIPENKNASILDLGCGMGNYLYVLKKWGYTNLNGVDLSQSNVDFCIENGIKCEQADALEHLKKNENTFDLIIFNDVIEHFTKNEMYIILIAMKKALRDGGKLIIKTYNLANPFTGISGRYMDFTHEIGFVDRTFYQILGSLDFKNIVVKGADIYVFGGPIGYLLKAFSKIVYFIWYLFGCLAGRTIIKIFEKNIICVAEK